MVGPTQGWSARASVKSSWATWIHHSCGSLMKIQMNAADDRSTSAAPTGWAATASGSPRRR